MLNNKWIITITLLISLTLITACSPKGKEVSLENNDVKEIRETALDYIEGWYEGDAVRMDKALHPDLVKRRIEGSSFRDIDRDTMVANTEKGLGKGVPKDTYEIEVEILDVNNNVASAVTKSQYIDYLHLAKIDNKWVIINVLWDYR